MSQEKSKQTQTTYHAYYQLLETILGPFFAYLEWTHGRSQVPFDKISFEIINMNVKRTRFTQSGGAAAGNVLSLGS